MELLTAPSKTDQVAAILRGMIKKGKYIPNSRLAGVRELAKQFQVSSCVVSCALETLQKEHLIRCEHGRGIFVEQWAEDDMIDVYMLLWSMENKPAMWFNEFIKITCPPFLQNNFSFTIRTIIRDSEEEKHLDAELARINSCHNIKCVLANATPFKLTQLQKFHQLHCPVIFYDTPKYKEAVDFACHSITGDNRKHGIHCAEIMTGRGHKEITLFTITRKSYFTELYYKGVKEVISAAGGTLHLYELPADIHQECHETIIAEYKHIFGQAAMDENLDKPVLLYGLKPELFPEVPDMSQRLLSDCPVMFPSFSGDLMAGFYNSIYTMIKTVIRNPDKFRKELFDMPFRLIDLTTNESFIVNQYNSISKNFGGKQK